MPVSIRSVFVLVGLPVLSGCSCLPWQDCGCGDGVERLQVSVSAVAAAESAGAARAVWARIAADETRHAQLAWDIEAWLAGRGAARPDLRRRAARRLVARVPAERRAMAEGLWQGLWAPRSRQGLACGTVRREGAGSNTTRPPRSGTEYDSRRSAGGLAWERERTNRVFWRVLGAPRRPWADACRTRCRS